MYRTWKYVKDVQVDGTLRFICLPFGLIVGVGRLAYLPWWNISKWFYWRHTTRKNGVFWQLRVFWLYVGYGWHKSSKRWKE